MRVRRQAPIYDKTGNFVLTYKAISFIEPLVEAGDLVYSCQNCRTQDSAKRLCGAEVKAHAMIYRVTDRYMARESKAYITVGEMQANVGLGSRRAVLAAQSKISNWRFEGDERNPLPNWKYAGKRVPLFRKHNPRVAACSIAMADAVMMTAAGEAVFINRNTAVQVTQC